jgi:hypothetical protein
LVRPFAGTARVAAEAVGVPAGARDKVLTLPRFLFAGMVAEIMVATSPVFGVVAEMEAAVMGVEHHRCRRCAVSGRRSLRVVHAARSSHVDAGEGRCVQIEAAAMEAGGGKGEISLAR